MYGTYVPVPIVLLCKLANNPLDAFKEMWYFCKVPEIRIIRRIIKVLQ